MKFATILPVVYIELYVSIHDTSHWDETYKASKGVMTNDTSRFEGMRCNIPTIPSYDF